ncbi:hypothetical protein [Indiicoccus explosivorum]|uniref:hypothetical protein n=1 Tax=Indiicoccus explosivorum TaxID=1917864 RepID=UPI000B4495E0|nr:hypothetical protein [Indiicoccus explosivorum]
MKQKTKDLVEQVVAVLSALLFFFVSIGVTYDWFTMDSINAFGVLLGAVIVLAVNLKGILSNHFPKWAAFRKANEKKVRYLEDKGIEFEEVEEPAVVVPKDKDSFDL